MLESIPAHKLHDGASRTVFRPEREGDRPVLGIPDGNLILGFEDQFTLIPPTPTHNGNWERIPSVG